MKHRLFSAPIIGRVRAFTLIELLTVITVIALLIGLLVPIVAMVQRQAQVNRTRATVNAVALAIRLYGWESISVAIPGGSLRAYPAWDWNQDQRLDGHPEDDVPGITATGHPDYPLYSSGYRGFLDSVKPELPASAISKQGLVIDSWRNVLRIGHAARIYGGDSFGVWSRGPNQIDGSPTGTPSDDLISWGTR